MGRRIKVEVNGKDEGNGRREINEGKRHSLYVEHGIFREFACQS